jgi:CBS domain-containing protein
MKTTRKGPSKETSEIARTAETKLGVDTLHATGGIATKVAQKAETTKTRAASGPTVESFATRQVHTCSPWQDLGAAAYEMWTGDCGGLPVVDHDGRPVGWITDRDICMAITMRGKRASEITVESVMSAPVVSCEIGESVSEALGLFADKRIRRLAIVDEEGRLTGVLSIADLLRAAKPRATKDAPSLADVVDAQLEILESWTVCEF